MRKLDVAGEDSIPNMDVLSDTTPWAIDDIKYWTQVFEVMEQEIINCLGDSYDEEDDTYTTKLIHIAQPKLHRIAARLRLMSYNDMISWALENIDVHTRSIISH